MSKITAKKKLKKLIFDHQQENGFDSVFDHILDSIEDLQDEYRQAIESGEKNHTQVLEDIKRRVKGWNGDNRDMTKESALSIIDKYIK